MRHATRGRRSTRRRVVLAGAALAGGAGVTGCLPGGPPAESSAPAGAPVTVRVHARVGAEDEAYTRRLAEFTAQNSRHITAVYEGLSDYYVKLVNLIVSGTAGDITYLHHSNLAYQQFATAGLLRPVDDLIAKDRFDLTPWFPPTKQGMEYEGKWWGLPIRGQIVWNTLYYNPGLVGGAGLPDPETWSHADLVANLQRLTKRGAGDDVEAFGAMPGGWGDFSFTVGLMRRFGGELVSGDGKQVLVNPAACQAALQWYYDAWHRARVLRGAVLPQGEGPFAALVDGRAAMVISSLEAYRADIHKALNGAYRLEFRVMPRGPTGRVGGIMALNSSGILKSSPHPVEAWEVLKWLANRETSFALSSQQTGSNTANFRKDCYCDERFLNDPRFSRKSMESVCKGAELPEPAVLLWNLRYNEFNQAVAARMNEIRDNKADPNAGWMAALKGELQGLADLPRDTGLGGGR
jgi:ABC-type glycerol-3-phosphate transport system substrate-binding protein